ncbi:MAG: CoA transferase, partial [Chloroflexi bacterium]|nr:CoA transferase [Chloroflexota bacterium]
MDPLLRSLRVLEVGDRAAAICGRLFAELGADVLAVRTSVEPRPPADGEARLLDAAKRTLVLDPTAPADAERLAELTAAADLVIVEGAPSALAAAGLEPAALARDNPQAVVVAITPFGLTGAHRDYRGSDLIAFHASGIARLLTGHVEHLEDEPPVRAAGEQSGFIAAITAACAAMHALYGGPPVGRVIDVSAQEAMSLMAARELAMPGFGGVPAPRDGAVRGGGAVIHVLPAADGYVAVSPREDHQWERWLGVLGDPPWRNDPRFTTRAARTQHFDALYPLMAEWSRRRSRRAIFETCQSAHVPCFPFGVPGDMLELEQLRARDFFVARDLGGPRPPLTPRPPFGLPTADDAERASTGEPAHDWLSRSAEAAGGGDAPSSLSPLSPPSPVGALPLAGIRVVDLSWVIAGPTCTRYLALMGAEVIKVEAPDRPDTGRTSELHDVLGQSKYALALDLKAPGALAALRTLIAQSDVVVENFATGVMERLGLGYEELRRLQPEIVLLSASGLGRSGPDATLVAYGNLLSAYSGFSALNGFPGGEPRTGLAWADPLCGLLMAFGVVAALHRRDRGGGGRHIDFSMLEALLWTMPSALLDEQLGRAPREPAGNDDPTHAPHGVYRCAGHDRWLAIAVTTEAQWHALCAVVPDLAPRTALGASARRRQRTTIDDALRAWTRDRDAIAAMDALQAAGVPAAATYSTSDLFADAHLWER